MKRLHRILFGLALVACAISYAAIASAQVADADDRERGSVLVTDSTDSRIAEMVRELGSSKFGERQSAYLRLVRIGKEAISNLEAAAKQGGTDTGTRCIEILLKIGREKDNRSTVIAALERVANEAPVKTANLARRHVAELKMSDEERAIVALTAAGARIFRGGDGNVFSVGIVSEREIVHLKYLPTLHSVRLSDPGIGDSAIERLLDVQQIKDLSLWDTSVSSRGFSLLSQFESLESLLIQGLPPNASDLNRLAEIRNLRSLSLLFEVDDIRLQALQFAGQIHRLHLSELLLTAETPGILNRFEGLGHLHTSVSEANDRHCKWIAEIQKPLSLNIERSPSITDAGWASLEGANLRSLTLMRTPITDSGLEHLSAISSLESLGIYDAPVTDEGLSHLASLKSLRSLSLRGTKVTETATERLKNALPELRHVRVDSAPIVPPRPAPVPSVTFRVSNYTGYKMASIRVGLTDEIFEKLKAEPNVDTVHFHRFDPNDEQIARLAEIPLKGIFVRSEKVTDRGILAWNGHETLETLSVSSPGIGDASVASILSMPSLDRLVLTKAVLTDTGVKNLMAGLSRTGKLSSLSLSSCPGITSDGFEGLQGIASLERLEVRECPRIDRGILEYAGRVAGLKNLHVGMVSVDASDIEHLDGLKLERLGLLKSQITPQAIERIVEMFPGLRHISFSGSSVTDSDMAAIGKLTHLKTLHVSNTEVGDEGLENLHGLRELTWVTAGESNVSEYGKQQFESAHPDARISLRFSLE